MKSMDVFQKLAELAEIAPPEETSEPTPVDVPAEAEVTLDDVTDVPVNPLPVEEAMVTDEALTKEEAIEEGAAEASQVVEEALEDDVPAQTVPDAPVEPDVSVDDQALLEALFLEREQLASYVDENLVSFGALARLHEAGQDETSDEAFRKSAAHYLEQMFTDEGMFQEGLDKMATQLFSDQEDIDRLYSEEGVDYVTKHLSSLVDTTLEKVASDLGDKADGNSIVNKTKHAVDGFVESIQRLKGINQEIATLESKINEAKDIHSQLMTSGIKADAMESSLGHLNDLKAQQANAYNFRAKGYGLAGLGAATLAGGAYLAGRHFGKAGDEEVDAPTAVNGATLNAGNQPMLSENGGTYKMANTQNTVYLDNILKLAGAHLLIDAASNEAYGEEMNKQASDMFDSIASMSRADMDTMFAKVALENYPEETLREIVAGTYTEEILEKTAMIASWDDLPAEELVKIAGAGSVSAKGAAGALRDASEKVQIEVAAAKAKAEGAGRENAGVQNADKAQTEADLAAYNVINNPEAYEVDKTASQEDIEAAVLLKQAAYDSYMEAEAFLEQAFRK